MSTHERPARKTARVSHALRMAVLEARINGTRQHQIAKTAGLHPQVASSLLNDTRPVYEDDKRVIAIGTAVGLKPDQCFERGTR